MACQLAKWAVYHVYDKDRYTGAIVVDYGYQAKVINWKLFRIKVTDTIQLAPQGTTDYGNIPTKTSWEYDETDYKAVEVDVRFKRADEDLRTTGKRKMAKNREVLGCYIRSRSQS